jgi:hypothetical protein
MKILTAIVIAVALSSTSALAFQASTSPEISVQNTQTKTPVISRFSDDDNDGAIASVYSQGLCSGESQANCGHTVTTPKQHR